MRPPPRIACAAATLALALGATADAGAASRYWVRGAGFGHGVGMSQYGAYGYALHGVTYDAILAHYYTGTALGAVDPAAPVRVLLQSPARAAFSGAAAAGPTPLDPARTYAAVPAAGGGVSIVDDQGAEVARAPAPVTVGGPGPLVLAGRGLNGVDRGSYRGALELDPRPGGGLDVYDVIAVEDYVRGVVAGEMPAAWPAEALKAQAVAARTYALTEGGGFLYPDTRSQVYRGVAGETPATDAAVAATRAQVVTYNGRPVITYFFSTSGGRTENVENAFPGSAPQPWLVSVDDPYDVISPTHRWGPVQITAGRAASRLHGLVRGAFRGIRVLRRGASPRVVSALVQGSGGDTPVTGAMLRARLGLLDTWAYFTTITASRATAGSGAGLSGGASTASGRGAIEGAVTPGPRGAGLDVVRLGGPAPVTVRRVHLRPGGAFRVAHLAPGRYRVIYRAMSGPVVRIGR